MQQVSSDVLKKQLLNEFLAKVKQQDARVKELFNVTETKNLMPLSERHYLICEGKIGHHSSQSSSTPETIEFSQVISKLVINIISEFHEIKISDRVKKILNTDHEYHFLDEKLKDNKNFLFYIIEHERSLNILVALSGFGKTETEWCSLQNHVCQEKLSNAIMQCTQDLQGYTVEKEVFVPFSRKEDRSFVRKIDGIFKDYDYVTEGDNYKAALIERFFRDHENKFSLSHHGKETILKNKSQSHFIKILNDALQIRDEMKKIFSNDIVEVITVVALLQEYINLDQPDYDGKIEFLRQKNEDLNKIKSYQENQSLVNEYKKCMKKVWELFFDVDNSDIIKYGARCSEDNLIDYLVSNADLLKKNGHHFLFNFKKSSAQKRDGIKIIPPCNYCCLHFPQEFSIIVNKKAGLPFYISNYRERVNLPPSIEVPSDSEMCKKLTSYLPYSYIEQYLIKAVVLPSVSDVSLVGFLSDQYLLMISDGNMKKLLEILYSKLKISDDILRTLLHNAADAGSTDVVTFLVERGVSVDVKLENGFRPLAAAVGNGHYEIVKILIDTAIKQEIDIASQAVSRENVSSIHYAVVHKRLEIFELLANSVPEEEKLKALRSKPDISKSEGDETSWLFSCFEPFHFAIRYSSIDVIKFTWNLLKGQGVRQEDLFIDSPDFCTTPLHLAALRGDYEIFRYIYKIFPLETIEKNDYYRYTNEPENSFKGGRTVLNTAIDVGFKEIAEFLLGEMIKHQNRTIYLKKVMIKGACEGEIVYSNVLYMLSEFGFANILDELLSNSGLEQKERENAVNSVPDSEVKTKLRPLHLAAAYGYRDVAACLLKSVNNADVNCRAVENLTPLHIASQNGKEEVVQLLLDAHADVNAVDYEGKTSLDFAEHFKHIEAVKLLLKNGAMCYTMPEEPMFGESIQDAYIKQGNKEDSVYILILVSILFHAVKEGNVTRVQKYLSNEMQIVTAVVNAKDKERRTSLHLAILNSKNYEYCPFVSIARNLLKKEANVNATDSNYNSALHIAARYRNLCAVKLLLKNGAIHNAQNKRNETPSQITTDDEIKSLLDLVEKLFEQVNAGNYQQVEKYVQQERIIINARNSESATPLYCAISNRDTVLVLLDRGADCTFTNNQGKSPLHAAVDAVEADDTIDAVTYKIVEDLLKHAKQTLSPTSFKNYVNAKTAIEGFTSLHVASKRGSLPVVKLLLENGAMVSLTTNENKTPSDLTKNDEIKVIFCKVKKIFEIVSIGKSKNASKNKSDKKESVSKGKNKKAIDRSDKSDDIFATLKADEHCKAIVNAINSSGYTSLCVAVVKRQVAFVESLLKIGANPNVFTNDGTSLLCAAFYNVCAVKSLLYYDADPTIVNENGCTSLHVIASDLTNLNRKIIVQLLIKKVEETSPDKLNEFINAVNVDGYTALDIAKMGMEDPDLDAKIKKTSEQVIKILESPSTTVTPGGKSMCCS